MVITSLISTLYILFVKEGKGENHFLKTSFLPETGAVKNNWLLCGGIGLIVSIFLFYICKPKRRKEKEE
ncbi:LPXTG cell wall anchor domain-containing protein [Enterococcus sp. DIV1072d]|uniref:LPXTG cell wall anchor domain-containing protein n=1 Tax=Enterococcus sp. DIV1072d TaxID=2774856 RepID=UPI003D2FE0D7